jgi:peroxiredoxin
VPGIIRCPGCGQEIDANSRFCVHCTARICPGCHGPVPPRAVYCPNCGFSVGPAVPGAAEQPPVPPQRTFTPSTGGITGPPPRQYPASQGGIIGPQPGPSPYYPEAQGAVSGTPIPQATPSQQYGAVNQQQGAYGSPGPAPFVSAQQTAPVREFKDAGPIRVRRFPPILVVILVVAALSLSGFAVYKTGWLETPFAKVQDFVGSIKLLQWLPFGNKDTTPPGLLNASVSNITTAGAVITWQTDEPSTSQVMICESTGGCTWTELNENLVTDHSVNIADLTPGTTYHFTATSTDAASNQGTAEGDFTTTSSQTAVTPLVISDIKSSNITDSGGTVTWTTDKPGTSQVTYGTTTTYGSSTTRDQQLSTSHSVTLADLAPSTTYHFKVMSQDNSGIETVSQDQTFTTAGVPPVTSGVTVEIGMAATDFTLPTLDGKQVSLNELKGKKVMINFWQDVQQSRNELTVMQEVYEKYPRDQLTVLAISWEQTPAITQTVVNSKGLTMTIPVDETGEVAAKYKVTQSPVTIFIDSQGIVRYTSYYPSTLKSFTRAESILNSMQ